MIRSTGKFIAQLIGTAIFAAVVLCLSLLLRFPPIATAWQPMALFLMGWFNWATSMLPFSLASIFLPLYIINRLLNIILNLVRMQWLDWICPLASSLLGLYLSFMLLFGYAYHVPSLTAYLPYQAEKHDVDTLVQVTEQLVSQLNDYGEKVERDSQGVVEFMDYEDQNEAINDSYKAILRKYNLPYPGRLGRVKSAGYLSVPMSYAGIGGFIFPFTAEATLSMDRVPTSLPFDMAHEQAHVLGVAPEDEAGFMAFLACYESGNADLAYSALLGSYVYASNAIYAADREAGQAISAKLSDNVRQDLKRQSEHYMQYETPVREISNTINDTYLQSNGQTDGVESYGLMVDMLISYFLAVQKFV